MTRRLADLRSSQLEEHDPRLLSLVTGLSARGITRRLNGAHGNSLMSSIFGNEWPMDADRLGPLTVATATKANLVEEISHASGLTRAAVRARLAQVGGKKKLLANLFPELFTENDAGGREEDEIPATSPSQPPQGRRRFLDGTATFSVTELLGDVVAVSVRQAPALAQWLSARTKLTERVVRSRFKRAHGRSLVRTVLTDVWPVDVGGPAHAILGDLTAGTVSASPPLLRWVADAAGASVTEVHQRVEKAKADTRISHVIPELVAGKKVEGVARSDGGEAVTAEKHVRSSERPSAAPDPNRHPVLGGRYALRHVIGEGGFGKVWEAERLQHPKRIVAVKVAHDEAVGQLWKEMDIAHGLQHQNICPYLDFGEEKGFGTYLVMAHCGKSLADILREGNALDVARAIDVLAQAAAGLDYAHQHNIIHHDVKPANVLLQERQAGGWDVRVGDFGISVQGRAALNTRGFHTVDATAPTYITDCYASPEHRRGEQAGKRSDQYALALVFCSMLEGSVFRRPYEPRRFARLSPRQNQALTRALSAAPYDRYDSCAAFAAALAGR